MQKGDRLTVQCIIPAQMHWKMLYLLVVLFFHCLHSICQRSLPHLPPATVHFSKRQCNCMDGQTPKVNHSYGMWQSKSLTERDTPARQILFNSTTSKPRTLIKSDAKSTKKKSKKGAKLHLHVQHSGEVWEGPVCTLDRNATEAEKWKVVGSSIIPQICAGSRW